MKEILVIAFLVVFSASANAQFDWAEGLNDFFADFGRPNCAHESEIADKACCSGLQEQYSGYLGETICTEYRETQQPTQNTPTQVSYPESEPVCYDDDYCQYVKGEGWKCNTGTNRCYYDGTSTTLIPGSLEYPRGEQIGQNIIESEKAAEGDVESIQEYTSTSDTLRKLSCVNNKECADKLGLFSICDTGKSLCRNFVGIDETSSCNEDEDCTNKYIYGWTCSEKNKCRNDISVKTGAYRCYSNSNTYGTKYCQTTFGKDYFCEEKSQICINKYTPSVDIVFVPLNYGPGEDAVFISTANRNLRYFEQLTDQQCKFKTAYIETGKCSVSCKSYCCIAQAQHCAVENGYVFAKRIVGVIKARRNMFEGGCALQPGSVLTVMSNSLEATFAHEIGHNFNFCHVFVDPASAPPYTTCEVPQYLCNAKCSNVPDCNLPTNDRIKDVMTYCSSRQKFGLAAYSNLISTCNKFSAGAEQQVLAAYVTVSRDGNVELNSVHIGYGTPDEEQGDYELVAYDDGRQTISEDFNVQFTIHADVENNDGSLYSEPVELNEYSTIVEIPYSPEIDEIKIEHSGQVLVAKDLSEIAADGNMFAQTSEGNTQITALPEDIAEEQGIKTTTVAYGEKEGNLVYSIEGEKTELFLGFIPIDEHVTATYDSTGNLLDYNQKPWWQFWG